MKVAFILSPFDQIGTSGFTTKKMKRVYGYNMPLGIAYLAAMVEQSGHEALCLDPCPQQLTLEEIGDWVQKNRPDLVGISAMTHTVKLAYELSELLKKRFPDIKLIMGGSHCQVFPESVLDACDAIDVVVIGEAEERIVALCLDLLEKGGENLEQIPGIIFNHPQTGLRIHTGFPPKQTNLDALPWPARHLFDHALYQPFPDQIRRQPVTNFMGGRGCSWGKCKFCFEGGQYMPPFRRRSAENVVDELIVIKKTGFLGAAIWDDNFTVQPRWVRTFVALMKERDVDLDWTCYGRVNTITEEMVKGIASVGCFSIYFGFESGNQEILDAIAKGTTLDQARKAVRLCHDYGIEVRGSFILGMPGDTPELSEKTIQFARELDLDSVKFMLYTPEHGTDLYNIALNSGHVINSGFLGSLSHATYLPDGYESASQLEKMAVKANRSYLLRPRFIWKKFRSIRSFADILKYFDGLRMVLSLRAPS